MQFTIPHRYTGQAACEIEIDASYADKPLSVQLGAAVKIAVSKNVHLAGANLAYAKLTGANLTGADLTYADLTGANLAGANLAGQGILQVNGLRWQVLITPEYLTVGCEKHSHDAWRGFDNRRILAMAGKEAAEFWAENKNWLLERCAWAANGHRFRII